MNHESRSDLNENLRMLRFPDARRYIRQMHPAYGFVFNAESRALSEWNYTPQEAKLVQTDMLSVVCASARKIDLTRGYLILIENELDRNEDGQATLTPD